MWTTNGSYFPTSLRSLTIQKRQGTSIQLTPLQEMLKSIATRVRRTRSGLPNLENVHVKFDSGRTGEDQEDLEDLKALFKEKSVDFLYS